jgi:hypothetical protein
MKKNMPPKKLLLRKWKKGPLCCKKNEKKNSPQYDTDVFIGQLKKNTKKTQQKHNKTAS